MGSCLQGVQELRDRFVVVRCFTVEVHYAVNVQQAVLGPKVGCRARARGGLSPGAEQGQGRLRGKFKAFV